MFKIRYKPFFSRIEHLIPALVPSTAPKIETRGSLTVTLVECRGLMNSILQGNVNATLGVGKKLGLMTHLSNDKFYFVCDIFHPKFYHVVGDLDWIAAYTDDFGSSFLIRDIVYIKTAKREVNLDFTLAM